MNKYTEIPSDDLINSVVEKLKENNIEAFVVENGEEAKKKFFELVPEGAEVFTNTSTTLINLGITEEVNASGKFVSLKNKVSEMPANTPEEGIKKRQIGTAMQYAVGSVHAITYDGQVLIASGSGSQIPGYAYGADHVVWVASANKIVEDLNAGLKRIYDYILPLENDRMKSVYGPDATSSPRKILIFNSDPMYTADRTKLILVKEPLGF